MNGYWEKNFTIEQCHTINIKLDKISKSQKLKITKPFKSQKLINQGIKLAPQFIDNLNENM